jgi:hypothetical protein
MTSISSNTNKNDSHGELEVKQSRGGRQSASEWQHMEFDDQNAKIVVCKYCNYQITKKIERVQNHLGKCANYKRRNRQLVIEETVSWELTIIEVTLYIFF